MHGHRYQLASKSCSEQRRVMVNEFSLSHSHPPTCTAASLLLVGQIDRREKEYVSAAHSRVKLAHPAQTPHHIEEGGAVREAFPLLDSVARQNAKVLRVAAKRCPPRQHRAPQHPSRYHC